MTAFQQMIPSDSFPLYVLFIDIDPSRVDINVHPTKQEIKFEDEKIVYAFVQAAVKHALAQFSITPSLDFDLDPAIQQLDAVSKPLSEEMKTEIESSSLFKTFTRKNQAHFIEPSDNSELPHWRNREAEDENFARSVIEPTLSVNRQPSTVNQDSTANHFRSLYARFSSDPLFHDQEMRLVQLQNSYIVCETDGGFLLIHQQAAHERVLYEKFMLALSGKPLAGQPGLFPQTLTQSTPDALMLQEMLPALQALGYTIEPFGKDSFIVQSTPAGQAETNAKKVIENLLEHCKHAGNEKITSLHEKMIRSLAWQQAIKSGTPLNETEMRSLTGDLFRCLQPNTAPNGRPVFVEFKKEYLEKLFGRRI
jgi:DNA mismatch repair protein MutL